MKSKKLLTELALVLVKPMRYSKNMSRTILACVSSLLMLSGGAVFADDAVSIDAATLVLAITETMRNDHEFPLEHTLESLRAPAITEIESGLTDGSDSCEWPRLKPEGVFDDEWKALFDSIQPELGENWCSTYMLVDMNEDGYRDLLQRNYVGGTGLFTSFTVFKREGARFVLAKERKGDEAQGEGDSELFTTNDRGANQWFVPIMVNERFYVAYVDGAFGQDLISLLRPVDRDALAGAVRVEYRYRFSVPRQQKFEGLGKERKLNLSSALQKTLEGALSRYVGGVSAAAMPMECPSPDGVSEDERAEYRSYGAGHYSYESVTDFPVWWNGRCHVARFVDWFGRYTEEDGLFAMLSLRQPKEYEGLDYTVRARRRATAVRIESDSERN